MPNSSTHPTQPRKRGGLIFTIVAVVAGCGIFTTSAGEHPHGPIVKFNHVCAAVLSPGSCTPPSLPPPKGHGTDRRERHVAPQLIPAEVLARPLDRGDGLVIVRGTPSPDGGVLYTLDPHRRATVKITCQVWGDLVQPPEAAPTALWDQVGPGEWVSDAYLDTGSNRPVTTRCDQSPEGNEPVQDDVTEPR